MIAPKETPNLPKGSLANTNQTDKITSQDDIKDMTKTYPTAVKPKLIVEDREIKGKLQREMKLSPKIVRDHTIAGKIKEEIQSTSKMEGDSKKNSFPFESDGKFQDNEKIDQKSQSAKKKTKSL